jgi:signal transduction histidine kinase
VRKPLIITTAIGVLTTLLALRVADLWWWRGQTLGAARSRAANLALILSEYMRETVAAGDASLKQLAGHSRRVGGPAAPEHDWGPALASAKASLGDIGSISVVDAAGIVRHSTLPQLVGVSRSDRYAFRRLTTSPDDDLIVDTPVLSLREPKQYLIPIARRLSTPDGQFAGLVVATLVPAVPRDLFRAVDVGPGGSIWVFHPDGVVLFREPSPVNAVGDSAIGNPIFDAARKAAGGGTLEARVLKDGPALLSAFRRMSTPPLIVAVSLDRDTVLQEWRRDVRRSLVGFAVLAGIVSALLLVLFRQSDARTNAERQLREAQQLEAIRLREANDRLTAALAIEQRAHREADAASRLKDEFLMTLSHELRTPLSAIYGWARLLVSGKLDHERQAAAIETIERSARHQSRVIDDLLDVSRAIVGKLRLEIGPVSLTDVLGDALEIVRPAADAKQIRLDASVEPGVGPVAGDHDRLHQIVWNLLSNAIKFTPPAGLVIVTLRPIRRAVELAVTDTGVGISPDILPHVFERFRQGHSGPARPHGGLGLGLAIARHLVELHGGSITAESAGEGRGSTFRVRLPTQAAVSDQNLSEQVLQHS